MALTDLRGKVAVITGGASGIGLALARRLLAEGMQVVLADLEQPALDEAAAALGVPGVRTDVRDEASLKALADAVIARFGAVHLLCNNAGVSRMAAIERLTAQDWRWLFDVNLFGVVNGVRAFLPLLKANPEGGWILNTASLSSLYPTRSQGAYAATKYAVAAFSETLALELEGEGSTVGVTVLCPGPVRTNIGTSSRNRGAQYTAAAPAAAGPDIHEQAFRASVEPRDWALPDDVAAQAVDAVKAGRFWVITHPHMMGLVEARHRAIEAAAGVVSGEIDTVSDAEDPIHGRQIADQFSRQAAGFAANPQLHADDVVELIVSAAALNPGDAAIDLACGPGSVACGLANHAARVVGLDATPAMLQQARALAGQRNAANIEWREGSIYAAPFPDGSFDAVTCRFAFHHFEDPPRAFAEMVRLAAPGGRIVLCDGVVSDDPEKALAFNQMERLRDPSTVEFRRQDYLCRLFVEAGLGEPDVRMFQVPYSAADLVAASFPEGDDRSGLQTLIERSVEHDSLGMGAHLSADGVRIAYRSVVLCAIKPGSLNRAAG